MPTHDKNFGARHAGKHVQMQSLAVRQSFAAGSNHKLSSAGKYTARSVGCFQLGKADTPKLAETPRARDPPMLCTHVSSSIHFWRGVVGSGVNSYRSSLH